MTLPILANALILSFISCCVVSALLQTLAWSRHARDDVPVRLSALWRPEGHFDDTGMHQMRLARRLLLIGGIAYLAYGALMLVANAGAA